MASRSSRPLAERLPAPVRAALANAVWVLVWGRSSRARRLVSLREYLRLRGVARAPAGGPPVEVRVAPIPAVPVRLRPGTSDVQVLFDTFVGMDHLPPSGPAPAVVWDLGANLGLTMADFAQRWPAARITGLEPQPALADEARRLVAGFGPRCRVEQAAVWTTDGTVSFTVHTGDEFGGHVTAAPGEGYDVPALSLDTLLARTGPVDYVKMDIEGAEATVLREHTGWARDVAMIKVECHGDYDAQACARDLQALGFTTHVDTHHWSCVLGRRV